MEFGLFNYGPLKETEVDAIMRTSIEQIRNAAPITKQAVWTEEKVEMRRQYIIFYLGRGYTYYTIQLHLMEAWNCKNSITKEYIKDAFRYVADCQKEASKHDREVMIQKYESIAEEALARGDNKVATKYFDMVNKIKGLYVNKIDASIEGDVEVRFEFGDKQ